MAKKIKIVVLNPEQLDHASEVWTKGLYECYLKHQIEKENKKETQSKTQ